MVTQVFILDSLSGYETTDPKDAEKIAERVLPRLQHVNSAVVLSAIKVIMRMLNIVTNEDLIKAWCKKMAPPLVTLLGTEPEVQYVALRNINLIIQKRPSILANEVKVCSAGTQTRMRSMVAAMPDRTEAATLLEPSSTA